MICFGPQARFAGQRSLSLPFCLAIVSSALIGVEGCSPAEEQVSESKADVVFESDDRAVLRDAEVLAAVGTLRGGHGACTAFAIGSKRIATARHCLDGADSALRFINGLGAEFTVVGTAEVRPAIDYAELVVSTTLPHTLSVAEARSGDTVRVVQVDMTSAAVVTSGTCTLHPYGQAPSAAFAHRCDTEPGASGGPVLRDGVVVGVHLGYAPSANANLALSTIAVGNPVATLGPVDSGFVKETNCETNCNDACDVAYNYPCPTLRNPGRMCRGHNLDPICKARCEVEREIECRTGLNACDVWATVPAWLQAREALRVYGQHDGLTANKCVEIVQLGGAAAGAAGFAYTAFIEGLKAALTLDPMSLVISKAAQHGAECACRKALP